jgi:hypothetical protein
MHLTFNDLLDKAGLASERVLILRHTPQESLLSRELGGLAAERPKMFNVYQQTQSKKVERQMKEAKYVASFIGHHSGRALFVGLYAVRPAPKVLTREEYWELPEHKELRDRFGMKGFIAEKDSRTSILWFDLQITDTFVSWKGKLVIGWPKPDIAWSRWARDSGGKMPVLAIHDESVLERPLREWDEIDWPLDQLKTLPPSWRSELSGWKGIYYIFDASDGKGYVGSAYGDANLAGRWQEYAITGHGGNRLLRERDHTKFRFSILQRLSPDAEAEEVIEQERKWKLRLHTRAPLGLNDN